MAENATVAFSDMYWKKGKPINQSIIVKNNATHHTFQTFLWGVWGKNNPILLLSVEKIRSQVGSFLMLKLQYSSQCRVCVGLKQSATDLTSHWSRFPLQNCVSM